jgi:hypothetical protein
MKYTELLTEKYDKKHKCLTPGTIYNIEIHSDNIKIDLSLPDNVNEISKKQSADLESDLHYAIEKVLASYFFK